jgi:ABC-type glycerol-3-phosphate transport system permease component
MSGLQIWNNFVWSLVVTSGDKVMPVILAITTISGDINQGDGVKLAGYIIASLPLLILFFVATKPFVSGLTQGAVKG